MFPVSDFNFVVCGIATFAATVGYAFTRKQSLTSASSESLTEVPSPSSLKKSKMSSEDKQPSVSPSEDSGASTSSMARRDSLKRKVPHDGFEESMPVPRDQAYPNNLANIYPNKRSRTPSSESDKDEEVHESKLERSIESLISITTDQDVDIPTLQQEPNLVDGTTEELEPVVETPAPEPPRTPSPVPEVLPLPVELTSEIELPKAEEPVTPKAMTSPETRPTTPVQSVSPFGTTSSSRGFAAFAGSTSPFASVIKPQQSPFRASRSLWNVEDTSYREASAFKNSLGDAFENQRDSRASSSLPEIKPDAHAIYAAVPSSKTSKFTHVTGEENEDVEQELKGVKMFVKRGNKPFSTGMVGHLKLLSHRDTLDERLLFRREPLWQVSMNVRVHPTVRCTYEAEENVVRLVLKEPILESTGPSHGDAAPLQLVVYALKPGRSCSKQDFKDFAESLVKNGQFKTASSPSRSRTATSVAP